MRKITARSQEVYEFVKKYIDEKKYSPSMREIAQALGTSTSVIEYCLTRLQTLGMIEREELIARSIRLTDIFDEEIGAS